MSAPTEQTPPTDRIRGPRRVHCGLHKCLTMYVRRVFERLSRGRLGYGSYRHFHHRLDDF